MALDADKRARLEAAGFQAGTADEFLGLTPDESALLDVALALGAALRERRKRLHLSQAALASRLKSSQSRVAKMEAGSPSVSVDLLMRALLATGATRAEIGEAVATGGAGVPG